VDSTLFRRLVIPGVLGAITGSYILTHVDGNKIKPWVAGYLMAMGILIFVKAFRKIAPVTFTHHLIPLGLIGGFLDASGGGGWGPVVVSTLVAFGNHPRMTIGSTNLAEFFVAFSASITFMFTLQEGSLTTLWPAIGGLAIGGAIAAPLAALFASKIPARALMLMVGILIMALSLRTIIMAIAH
jgi:uncharacterized protein